MSHGITKTKIKDVFRQLVIESSFAKVKVADIIAKAGVSRMTFYRHYPDKYALLEELCFDDFNLFVQIYGRNATWKQVTMSILNVIRDNGVFYQKILEDKEAGPYLFLAQHDISQQYTGKIAVQGTNTAWEAPSATGQRMDSGKRRKRFTARWCTIFPFEKCCPKTSWSGRSKAMKTKP